jgi:hypothetical protein
MVLSLLFGKYRRSCAKSIIYLIPPCSSEITPLAYRILANFVIAFKLNSSAAEAMAQIQSRGYYQKYLHQNKEVVLIGLGCADKKELITEKDMWNSCCPVFQ